MNFLKNARSSAVLLLSLLLAVPFAGAAFSQSATSTHKAKPKKTAVHPLPPLLPMPVAGPSPIAAPTDTLLYDGVAADTAGLDLSSWGGGSLQDTTEFAFSKGHSLKLTTLDPYEGGKVTFGTPVDLGNVTADKTRYLVLTLRFGQLSRDYAPLPTPRNIRLVLTLVNGAQAETVRPIASGDDSQSGAGHWIDVAVPLTALGFTGPLASSLQSLVIAGDDYGVVYIGQIKLTNDTTPLSCFAGDQLSVYAGQPVALHGTSTSGLSTVRYSWDFDAADGVTDQAEGQSVSTAYVKAGDYTVTLTVSDIDGIKAPTTSTTTVHVQ